MEQITPVMPVAPTPPGASERPVGGTAGGVPETPTSLLGPILLGAACGWIVSSVSGGGVYSLVTLVTPVSLELARAGWLTYLQPAVLLAVTGTLVIRSVWGMRVLRGQSMGMRLALLIAWVPYLARFVLPQSFLQPDLPREIGGLGIVSALQGAPLATLLAVAWLTGIIAVFVWGNPRSHLSRMANIRGRAVMSRWLAVAVAASVAFALVALLRGIALELLVVILNYSRHDPTCAGLCAPDIVVPHLIVPMLLSIALGLLGGVVGGVVRFGSAPLRSLSSHREAAPAEEGGAAAMSSSDSGDASTSVSLTYPRSLPGSRYWGSFLLGVLSCGCWMLALFLSGIPSQSAPVWRAPAQVVLLLALAIGVVVYVGWRVRRDSRVLSAQAVYALLVVVAGLLASLLEALLLTGSHAGGALLLPFFAPVVLPLFGPALSLGVTIGFAWGTRRPEARSATIRLGGVGAVLWGWVGFSLCLIGFVVWGVVLPTIQAYAHVPCYRLGCIGVGIMLFAVELNVAIVILFAPVLMLLGLAIGRRLRLAALRQMALAAQ